METVKLKALSETPRAYFNNGNDYAIQSTCRKRDGHRTPYYVYTKLDSSGESARLGVAVVTPGRDLTYKWATDYKEAMRAVYAPAAQAVVHVAAYACGWTPMSFEEYAKTRDWSDTFLSQMKNMAKEYISAARGGAAFFGACLGENADEDVSDATMADIYDAMGGNGEPMYLSDGVWARPDGSTYDERH